ncbi:uncharacterized protein K489DRAFT_408323 [Dissoconium aciculare CBS 342.82]|uniref:Uncharacterized protein n=1 Tax=Dissoconium aciculare CBS 342.82 TaxID=1314786 RepID=A0A6J3MCU9_9PEZI|nr:uncharacterized protein K489DRAFT_408323 [Dissoconium aciculare CBS 342.82]KAF1825703.1 hypothetical protein K489DRAFT_408323 [Dissoconium aciculare CBS 342.82]
MSASDQRNFRPRPTTLVLLDQVPLQPAGSKIRFLGCVQEYRASRAQLVLRTKFPATTQSSELEQQNQEKQQQRSKDDDNECKSETRDGAIRTAVIADVSEILSTLDHELVTVGAWVNIIGDVKWSPTRTRSSPAATTTSTLPSGRRAQASRSNTEPGTQSTSERTTDPPTHPKHRHHHHPSRNPKHPRPAIVQATMLWSAGAVKTSEYEIAVGQFQKSLLLQQTAGELE